AHLKEKKATTLVLTEVFFGVGALLIPVISAFFIMTGKWNGSFFVVMMVTLLAVCLWVFLPFVELADILKKQLKKAYDDCMQPQRTNYSRKHMPIRIFVAAFFFMYVATERVLPNYLPTSLGKTTTLGDSALAISITAFCASMTIGRSCMTLIIDRIGY